MPHDAADPSFPWDDERDELAVLRLARFSLDRSGDGVLWIAPDARLLYANDTICALLGYRRDELLRLRITDINPDFPPAAWPAYWARITAERAIRLETRHRRKDGGEVPIEVTSRYLEFDGQAYLCSFVRDITERRRAREAEMRLFEQERALAALRERERLARELHDTLGQVLAFVQLQAQAALERLGQGETAEAAAALAHIRDAAADRTADVREFILGVNVQAAPERGLFTALEEYLARFGRTHGIATGLDVPPDLRDLPLPPTRAVQLLRIVQEALANVRKHAGATVARVYVERTDTGVQLVVADNGRGFDPRATAAGDDGQRYGVRGMRERAAEIGAALAIDSRPGLGTRVVVRLPAEEAPRLDGVRVLLVDDHPLFLQGMQALLTSHGVTVVGVAQSGEAGVTQARALRPQIVLMDVEMPGMGGIAATRQIAAELPGTTVVMLTMAEDDEHLFEALRGGASGYLLKGLDAGVFFELLGQAARGEAPLAPGLAARVLAEFGRQGARPVAPEREPTTSIVATEPPVEAQEARAAGGRVVPAEDGGSATPVALSERQVEVLTLVAQGYTYQAIGERLHLSKHTVRYHMREVITQLHLTTRAEIVALARRVRGDAET